MNGVDVPCKGGTEKRLTPTEVDAVCRGMTIPSDLLPSLLADAGGILGMAATKSVTRKVVEDKCWFLEPLVSASPVEIIHHESTLDGMRVCERFLLNVTEWGKNTDMFSRTSECIFFSWNRCVLHDGFLKPRLKAVLAKVMEPTPAILLMPCLRLWPMMGRL